MKSKNKWIEEIILQGRDIPDTALPEELKAKVLTYINSETASAGPGTIKPKNILFSLELALHAAALITVSFLGLQFGLSQGKLFQSGLLRFEKAREDLGFYELNPDKSTELQLANLILELKQ